VILASLDLAGWAAVAAIAGAVLSLVTLPVIAYQLWMGNRDRQSQVKTLRSTATMLFQERFKESQKARGELFMGFPLHDSLVAVMAELSPDAPPDPEFPTWTTVGELGPEQRAAAGKVINACNDVAQYVVDGLELRSALQQYHLPLLRVGALLNPYLLQINAEGENGRALRIGRRIPILYNAALAYHRCNSKHKGRPAGLERIPPGGGEKVALVFLDKHGDGATQFEWFPDTPEESLLLPDEELSKVISAAEEKLRR
jgi:hypothetical protein